MLKVINGEISFKELLLLQDINLEINSSELTIIIGPNGSGKTSLLNVLAGTTKLSKGSLHNSFNKKILIPQNLYYPEDVTLFDYVSSVFYREKFKWFLTKDDVERVFCVLEKLNLRKKQELTLNKLSAGELQLANIALCLISEADLILLDEPTSNLDLVNQLMILDMIKELTNHEISVIVVMHDINLASKYGDKFLLTSHNFNLIHGDKHWVLTNQNLSDAYNIDIEKLGLYTCF
ncbi:MAG: ABC transporter ATP-binding protein [Candidatus Gastranaerophilales bacterium]|nr:ABC transporter ATP-binding protein [Candidatus Gastranaerophilales bacterium]